MSTPDRRSRQQLLRQKEKIKMASNRIGRINEEVMRELAQLIRTVKDPRVDGLVSITRVDVTPDMRYAKVFVSVLGDNAKLTGCIKGLKSASGYLRRELSHKLQLRYTPELLFTPDSSITHGVHIMELIEQVSQPEDKDETNES